MADCRIQSLFLGHRVILQLGRLDLPKSQWKTLADRIEDIVKGRKDNTGELFATSIEPIDPKVETLANHYANLLISKKISEEGEEFEAVEVSITTNMSPPQNQKLCTTFGKKRGSGEWRKDGANGVGDLGIFVGP